MTTEKEVFETIRGYLVELFDIPENTIVMDAHLGDDLDLDSIDAVDLALKIQTMTGRKIAADEFQSVRYVRDVVRQIHGMINEPA
ncbi:acyl carrier protein [Emcibacter sp. SYSU 3D8]|uniref:acyl carrier protein n=1 Tax=Emcibacter sp. SYSU 3D8 TaxID=3133969 RepID=UPI0031FEC16B